jgi:hypothetical protein|tara:strand:- start:1052 stop:1507 length:456 start_codon:yes stop_codon:yes gene_type:complete
MYNNHTNTKQQYQDFSTKIIVAITGAREDVEADYWGFFNTNATDAGLHHFGEARVHWVTPTTAQFYTTRERLMNGLELRSINKLLQDNPDAYDSDEDENLLRDAKQMAQEWFDSMERVTDIIKKNVRDTVYNMGTITAEKPDSDYGNRESL